MQIRELNEIKNLKLDSNYVVLRFNGLFGVGKSGCKREWRSVS